MSPSQKVGNHNSQDLVGLRSNLNLSRTGDGQRKPTPSPLQTSETSATTADNYAHDGSANPRSPTSFRPGNSSQYSPRSPRFSPGADHDSPKSPRARLDELLASESSATDEEAFRPIETASVKGAALSSPKTQSYGQLRNVSSSLPNSYSAGETPPYSPITMVSSAVSSSTIRPEPRPMPRTSSIDSAISAISSATSHSHQSSQDSFISSSAEIANLISTVGSPEAVILHLLKEKQHSVAQNTQLWRLVDKQRTLVLGLNTDLDRALKDKERYRKKLKEYVAYPSVSSVASKATMPLPRAASETPAYSELNDELPIQSNALPPNESQGLQGTRGVFDNALDARQGDATSSFKSASTLQTAIQDASRVPLKKTFRNDANSELSTSGSLEESPQNISHPVNGVVSPSSFTAKRALPLLNRPIQGPSLELVESTPIGDNNEKSLPPLRKPPPAPLDLRQPSRGSTQLHGYGPGDHSESEYDDILEVDEIPAFDRGRKKTRGEDDKIREAVILQEQESRSQSKKDKHSKPPPEKSILGSQAANNKAEPQDIPIPSSIKALSPLPTAAAPSAHLEPPASLASVLSPSQNQSLSGPHKRSLVPLPPMSPGLPVSPRPGDRPMNPPTPRVQRDGGLTSLASPALFPRNDSPGLPLSPRAPRQPIPLPPHTPMSMTSPKLTQIEPVHHSAIPQTTANIAKKSLNQGGITSESEPDPLAKGTPQTSWPKGVCRGLVSENYPELLVSPNALPSICIKVTSSRLKPSRHSYLAAKGSEEDPVFTLGVFARSDQLELWQVEKPLTSLPHFDHQLRQSSAIRVKLPDRTLFTGHAPAKIDARRMALEQYFETVLDTPLDIKAALTVCRYLSTHVLEPNAEEVYGNGLLSQVGSPVTFAPDGRILKEGYLTKRGKNFGGWKARFFVLDAPVLRYFESPGGPLLGTIKLRNAQIGKQSAQQHSHSPQRMGEDSSNQYRHAFLVLEPKRKDSNNHVRHVLCAESDAERDQWVAALLHYVSDHSSDDEKMRPSVPRNDSGSGKTSLVSPKKKSGKVDRVGTDSPDSEKVVEFQTVSYENTIAAQAPIVKITPDHRYTDSPSPDNAAMWPNAQAPSSHVPKSISRPSNGAVIQDAGAWGNKSIVVPAAKDKDSRKRSIWSFRDRPPVDLVSAHSNDSNNSLSVPHHNERTLNLRPVFGAPLAEAVENFPPRGVDVCLPAVVYRCLEYLEAKDASNEEGIFRLSGSNIVIKALRERFNTEGDFDFLANGQYHDVHAIASLLKLYLRELPSTVLTRELHLDFLQVLGEYFAIFLDVVTSSR